MKKLFGTDGIRGLAGKPPLTPALVQRLGQAAGHVLKRKVSGEPCRVLGVRDTRGSGARLFKSLAQGLNKAGVDVYDGGVLCTPSVAYLVRAHRLQSGVVISASHNAPPFNGIKFFTAQGRKWPDAWEAEVERIFAKNEKKTQTKTQGKLVHAQAVGVDYQRFLKRTLPPGENFLGMKVALDCSNGANSAVAPQVLKDLGATVYVIGAKPNGRNINVGCGSQNTKKLAALVKKKRCDIGIAFDGDADRVILVDEKGHTVDGDFVIGFLAKYLLKAKRLRNRKAAITVMSNLGLKKALSRLKIKTVETAVGDRHVSEAMKKNELVLGGEQSGHIILGHYLPTGDGLLTALHVLQALKEGKKPFSKQISWMRKYPQVLLNVPVREKRALHDLNGVQSKINEIEKTLGDNGRVLVRYSGTEPLLRIMLEGLNQKKINSYAHQIAKEVTTAIK